jgi:hypothetical protein
LRVTTTGDGDEPTTDQQADADAAGSTDRRVAPVECARRERVHGRRPATVKLGQLSFAGDSRLIAVASVDATATVWDVRDRKRVGEPFPMSATLIPAVAFEPGGRLFITELGAASEWPVDVTSWERFACGVVNRSLSPTEWTDLLPNRSYRQVCP